jgi:DNA polymerase V
MPITIFKPKFATKLKIPLYLSKVKAGFPSPAEEYIEAKLDLNTYLIEHPSSTYMVRIEGDSMIGAGIYSGDLAVVDRSLEPGHRDIVLAVVDGDITIKRLIKTKKEIMLCAENPDFEPIRFGSDQELTIWGVVVHTVRNFKA